MRQIFIGFEYSPKPDWQELMPAPKKPANWKEETYQSKLPELREKQKEGAAEHLLAGSVNRACLIDTEEGMPTDMLKGITGDKVIEYLADMKGDVEVYGFETLESLRLCGWSKNKTPPYWIWNSGVSTGNTIVNLYSCSGAKQAGLTVSDMIYYWLGDGVDSNALEVLGESAEDESSRMAAAAFTIAKKMGLVE